MANGFLDDLPRLAGYSSGKKKKNQTPPPEPPEDVCVKYVKLTCPRCGSIKVPVYNTNHLPIRYHKCSDCGFLFKSVE